jgi:hypothetical protein
MSDQANAENALKSLDKALDIAVNLNQERFEDSKFDTSQNAWSERLQKIRQISEHILEFYNYWNDSDRQGNLATFGKEVDMTLFKTNHLDLNKMKQTMLRSNTAKLAVRGLECIEIQLIDFKLNGKISEPQVFSKENKLLSELITRIENQVKKDLEDLQHQIDNANLYYQVFMASKTEKIALISLVVAVASLLVSCLAFILSMAST